MRLGQLSRSCEVPISEIVSYLDSISKSPTSNHPNSKVDDETSDLVLSHFGAQELAMVEESEVISEEPFIEESVEVDPIIEGAPEVAESVVEEQRIEEVTEDIAPTHPASDSVTESEDEIYSDKLLALMESEGAAIDLSKITRIKAPKKELEGLKVVGKIDLPEPKPKAEKEEKESSKGNRRNQRPKLTEEEREKRRLYAKRKKEEYEERKKRRQKEKEQADLKARKTAHYQGKLQSTKPTLVVKKKKSKGAEQAKAVDTRPKPKTALGRFWRWLNTE